MVKKENNLFPGQIEDIKKSANDFSCFYRRLLNLPDNNPLNKHHLQRLSMEFDLTPIAYTNLDGHWVLVVSRKNEGILVYDPLRGLEEKSLSSIKRIHFYLKDRRHESPQYFMEHGYDLPVEKFSRMGILQEFPNDRNCGLLSVFAAKFAKEA